MVVCKYIQTMKVLALSECVTSCIALDFHTIVPGLGMPSFLTRVIDIVSVMGHSLLVIVHVYTNVEGKLKWHFLQAPCAEYRENHSTRATGAETCFRFHSAPNYRSSMLTKVSSAAVVRYIIIKCSGRPLYHNKVQRSSVIS